MKRYRGATPEGSLQWDIMEAARALGLFPRRFNVVGFRGRSSRMVGTPDLYMTLPRGRACWIEVKPKGERPTEDQLAFLAIESGRGAICAVVHSVSEFLALMASAGIVEPERGRDTAAPSTTPS